MKPLSKFLPSRNDAFVLLLAMLVVFGAIGHTADTVARSDFMMVNGRASLSLEAATIFLLPTLVSLLAAAVVLSLGRSRFKPLLLMACVLLILNFSWVWLATVDRLGWSQDLSSAFPHNDNTRPPFAGMTRYWRKYFGYQSQSFGWNSAAATSTVILSLVLAGVLFGVRRFAGFAAKLDRGKLVTGLLGIFLLLGVATSAMRAGDSQLSAGISFAIVQFVVLIIVVSLFLVWPAKVLTDPSSDKKRLPVVVFVLSVIAAMVIAAVVQPYTIIVSLAYSLFLLVCWALSPSPAIAGQQGEADSRPQLRWLPIVGVAILLIGSSWFAYRYDIRQALSGGFSGVLERMPLAAESADLNRASNGQLQLIVAQNNTGYIFGKFDPTTPPDILQAINVLKSARVTGAALSGVNPSISLKPIQQQVFVTLVDCKLSPEQLDLVANSTTYLSITNGKLLDPTHSLSGSGRPMNLTLANSPEMIPLFTAIGAPTNQIYITGEVDAAGWRAILSPDRMGMVRVENSFPADWTDFENPNINELQLPALYTDKLDVRFNNAHRQWLDVGGIMAFEYRGYSNQLGPEKPFWDRAFCYPRQLTPTFELSAPSDIGEYHWAYPLDSKDEIGLWIPTSAQIPKLDVYDGKRVSSVSFDRSWVLADASSVSFGFGGLASTGGNRPLSECFGTELETVYFQPTASQSDQISRLAGQKKIRHLQVYCPNITVPTAVPYFPLDQLPTLESIRFIGIPSVKRFQEMAKLPNLKTLEILYSETDPDADRIQAIVNKLLPGSIDCQLIVADIYEPEIPEDFQRHLKSFEEKRSQYFEQ